ncbi:MAG: delta-60 repeat domain-containing protein, partial [Chthoniobacterales bacterium]
KILAGGFFSTFNGAPHYNLVRLNADASIDPSFNASFQSAGSVRAIALQPDGKILIAGVFREVNGVAVGRIARLNSNGTLDASFDPGIGADGNIYAMALDSSGNIFIGGTFVKVNGVNRSRIAKLGPNGALDIAFDPGTGPGGQVFALGALEPSGNLVVGGLFFAVNGTSAGASRV